MRTTSLWLFTALASAGVAGCLVPDSLFGKTTSISMAAVYTVLAIGGWVGAFAGERRRKTEAAMAAILEAKYAARKQSPPVGHPTGAGGRKARS